MVSITIFIKKISKLTKQKLFNRSIDLEYPVYYTHVCVQLFANTFFMNDLLKKYI